MLARLPRAAFARCLVGAMQHDAVIVLELPAERTDNHRGHETAQQHAAKNSRSELFFVAFFDREVRIVFHIVRSLLQFIVLFMLLLLLRLIFNLCVIFFVVFFFAVTRIGSASRATSTAETKSESANRRNARKRAKESRED